ncbi:hypothetical protein KM295_03480 [Natronomonas sp. F2-12]|jgi:hypothetical protein|uniref:Uncharacterized protein n=1 Tax=Natronomonas aquatica TaxID=2841590 RepID=A0A9R1D3Q4_9EURY|nr:hypothetical protein [Natronomonas aquatica]MCQ4332564.1 hypothetical protein [Natronomonas aquatica]
MLRIRGSAGGTALTGTLYEPGENPPTFRGAPDDEAPYVWVCDSFYEVESGGQTQTLEGREIQVAFESPMPRGFEDKAHAIDAATAHVRTQFARLGVDESAVDVDVLEVADDPTA